MWRALATLMLALTAISPAKADVAPVRIKDLGHFQGWRDNALVGYGLVTGLDGSGDSPNSEVTRQAIRNVLGRMGANVAVDQVRSRNAAVVMVVATLPASAAVGDRIDVNVTSIGDARSLGGGTLLMTPLMGPDQRVYALAQGPLIVGGFRFDADYNSRQKNSPTGGLITQGASVEVPVTADLRSPQGLIFLLRDPDFTTAQNVADGINAALGAGVAQANSAEAVHIAVPTQVADIHRLLARIESIAVVPDQVARIVVNERAGTVVAGGGARLSAVTIAQGDVKVTVEADHDAPQSFDYEHRGSGAYVYGRPATRLSVNESEDKVVNMSNASVTDLVQALNQIHVSTRTIIAILQAIKAAGALHAEIVIQ